VISESLSASARLEQKLMRPPSPNGTLYVSCPVKTWLVLLPDARGGSLSKLETAASASNSQ